MTSFALSLAAILALLPGALRLPDEGRSRPDGGFWLLLGVALAGAGAQSLAAQEAFWPAGFSATVWISILASLVIFAGLAVATHAAWRLMPLLFAYLALLGLAASISGLATAGTTMPVSAERAPLGTWITLHILFAVGAYALATLAAVAALSVLVKERALKRKRTGRLSGALPAVAQGERLQVRLLVAAAVVLGLDILTGMATQLMLSGDLLRFEHKTLLSLLAFAVISGLLAMHLRSGLRGQRAARLGLVAYLLLTLAYPGVKFVTDVLLA